MSLATIPRFEITEQAGARITLRSAQGHIAHLFVLEEDILRLMVLPGGTLNFPRTWAVAPGLGDLDYYFIAGPSLAEVVRRYTWLTGRPAFTPKWSLGYSGSTMAYTDAPNA